MHFPIKNVNVFIFSGWWGGGGRRKVDLCMREILSGISNGYRDIINFEKLCLKLFSVHIKTQRERFQIPPV